MDNKKIKLNAALGGYFTGNLPESAAVCAFAIDKSEDTESFEEKSADEYSDSAEMFDLSDSSDY